MSLQFEWDKKKAASNLKKHKVSFNEASSVFSDPLALIFDDERHSQPDELREIIIGNSVKRRLLLVSYTERSQDVIRIISSRAATKHEQRNYEENS
ncbi:MAG: BrnT family toxin [Candidatus Electrothrix communis]|nr:MAG: BrnT family toxin [Candidatus Electrothrix communis]